MFTRQPRTRLGFLLVPLTLRRNEQGASVETVAFGPSYFSKFRNPADGIKGKRNENSFWTVCILGSILLEVFKKWYVRAVDYPCHYPSLMPPRLNCKSMPISGGVMFLCFHNAARPGYNMMSLQHNTQLHREANSLSTLRNLEIVYELKHQSRQ